MENYSKAARHISTFRYIFTVGQKDSALMKKKHKYLLQVLSGRQCMEGIKTWLEDVSILNLQGIYSMQIVFLILWLWKSPVSAYFNHFNEAR